MSAINYSVKVNCTTSSPNVYILASFKQHLLIKFEQTTKTFPDNTIPCALSIGCEIIKNATCFSYDSKVNMYSKRMNIREKTLKSNCFEFWISIKYGIKFNDCDEWLIEKF